MPPSSTEEKSSSTAEEMSSSTVEKSHSVEERPQSDAEEKLPEWKPGRQEYLIMISLSIISLMVALDATVLVPALPAIAISLQGTATSTFWAGTSYLLSCAVFQPFIAALSDIFGRRELLLMSLSFFTLGSVIACTSQVIAQLLVGRSIQGIGGGGVIALTMVIFTDIVPLRWRPKYYSLVQVAWAFGTVLGPVIGGAIAQNTTWRWIFYMNFPFCAVGFVMIPLVLRLNKESTTLGIKLGQVDWIGGALFISGTTSFLIAITWGGVNFPWGSFQTIVPLILGVFGIVLSFGWERWGAKNPFLRILIFNNQSAIASFIGSSIQGLLLFGQLYYIPLYFESVKGVSPTVTGINLFPVTFTLTPASAIVGVLITRMGYIRWAIWSGWIVTTLATGLLVLWGVQTSTISWIFILIVLGLGHGLLLSALNFSVQAIAGSQNVAYAAAMYAFMRNFGMCIGVAVGGTVFQNLLERYLGELGLDTTISKDAEGFISTLNALPDTLTYKIEVVDCYARALRGVFIAMTAVSALGGLISLLIRSYSLDQALESEHVLHKGKEEAAAP